MRRPCGPDLRESHRSPQLRYRSQPIRPC
jgi:hypothetical protein